MEFPVLKSLALEGEQKTTTENQTSQSKLLSTPKIINTSSSAPDSLPTQPMQSTEAAKSVETPIPSNPIPSKPSKPLPPPRTSTPHSTKIPHNYRLLNNPDSRSPKKPDAWKTQVPTANPDSELDTAVFAFAAVQDILENEPTTVTEAQGHPDWPKWKETMDAEIMQLKNLGTY